MLLVKQKIFDRYPDQMGHRQVFFERDLLQFVELSGCNPRIDSLVLVSRTIHLLSHFASAVCYFRFAKITYNVLLKKTRCHFNFFEKVLF